VLNKLLAACCFVSNSLAMLFPVYSQLENIAVIILSTLILPMKEWKMYDISVLYNDVYCSVVHHCNNDNFTVNLALMVKSPASTVIGAIGEASPKPGNGRVASGRASGIKSLPQHSSFEYQWVI
jgi:hypothetical protein